MIIFPLGQASWIYRHKAPPTGEFTVQVIPLSNSIGACYLYNYCLVTGIWFDIFTNGLVQDCGNSIANAMDIPQSFSKPWTSHLLNMEVYFMEKSWMGWCRRDVTSMYKHHIDGSMHDCNNFIANAMEILQNCTIDMEWYLFYINWSRGSNVSLF